MNTIKKKNKLFSFHHKYIPSNLFTFPFFLIIFSQNIQQDIKENEESLTESTDFKTAVKFLEENIN